MKKFWQAPICGIILVLPLARCDSRSCAYLMKLTCKFHLVLRLYVSFPLNLIGAQERT